MGAYGTPANGYIVLDYVSGDVTSTPDSLGNLSEPHSPLLTGVVSLAASLAYRSTSPVINGGIVVARWGGGGQEPLVVHGVRGNRTLVQLNFFPASASVDPAFWTGDGAVLMRNALKYSRCTPCRAGTFSVAGELSRGWGAEGEPCGGAGAYLDRGEREMSGEETTVYLKLCERGRAILLEPWDKLSPAPAPGDKLTTRPRTGGPIVPRPRKARTGGQVVPCPRTGG